MAIVGSLFVLIGSIFLLLASIGIVRMPDVFNRIQAGTKATTLGTILVSIGVAFYHPEWIGKILILILFVLITNPIAGHVIARAAHFVKSPLTDKTVVDKLRDAEMQEQEK